MHATVSVKAAKLFYYPLYFKSLKFQVKKQYSTSNHSGSVSFTKLSVQSNSAI